MKRERLERREPFLSEYLNAAAAKFELFFVSLSLFTLRSIEFTIYLYDFDFGFVVVVVVSGRRSVARFYCPKRQLNQCKEYNANPKS